MGASQVRPAESLSLPPGAPDLDRSFSETNDGDNEVFWDVSPHTYRLVWLSMLLLYLLILIFLLIITGEYVVFMFVAAFSYYADTFNLIPAEDIPVVVVFYSVVVAAYFVHVLQFAYYSLRYRRLVFPAALSYARAQAQRSERLQSASRGKPLSSSSPPQPPPPPQRILKRMATSTATIVVEPLQRQVLSTSGLCGVRGVFFEPVVLLRELIEIAIQTYQAYQCSKRTTKFWINATFALLIVVNCYSSPLLHRFSKSSVSATRVAVLCVDLALDLVWFAVIPTLLWFPYLMALMGCELFIYRDTYVVEAIMEMSAHFVTSYVDLVIKLWPPVSIYFTMRKIELLTRRMSKHRAASDASLFAASTKQRNLSSAGTQIPGGGVKTVRLTCKRVEKWLRIMLLGWGHVIFAAFVWANFINSPSCSPGCQLVLRPWFHAFRACQCAAMEINCLALGIEGTATQIHDALRTTSTRGLLNLMFTHCPALQVPPLIRSLKDLRGFVVLNSTIESWDDDTAFTSALHPQLGYVFLVHTFVSEVPSALLQGDLPPSLIEIDIVSSNLSSLPDNLHEKWPHVTAVLLENGKFEEYPVVLGKMAPLEMLSLYANQITHVPDDALHGNRHLRYWHVAENPLRALPASLGSLEYLFNVLAMQTEIEDVYTPLANGNAYMLSQLHVFGFGGPMCGTHSSEASSSSRPAWGAQMVVCEDKFFTYMGVRSNGYYPLDGKLAEKKYVAGELGVTAVPAKSKSRT